MKTLLSSLLLKLRQRHPFLATIMMFTDYRFTQTVACFFTNGKTIDINKDYFERLARDQQAGVLLHTSLHCALLHITRRKHRDGIKWNLASDIVVNNIIAEVAAISIPSGTAHNPNFEDLSVEQIYEKLSTSSDSELSDMCQLEFDDAHTAGVSFINDLSLIIVNEEQAQQLNVYWKRAVSQAHSIKNSKLQGQGHLGLIREIDAIAEPQLDWRTHLWRFMTPTPCDFSDFDRRFIHQGLYVEQLLAESLHIIMAIDTSGSIEAEELTTFMSETKAILQAYPHIQIMLYFIDDEMVGPYFLNEDTQLPDAIGGGGTDFHVFFDKMEKQTQFTPELCLYLTDGFAEFPDKGPDIPMLWIVTSGGADTSEFPFGEVTRLAF